ncbi:cobalamin B12-binding domain-containing protein [Rhizobium glycinendophyticum]|nr:cobalamin-dependent protein [Rhizobium glycinendophyticum]
MANDSRKDPPPGGRGDAWDTRDDEKPPAEATAGNHLSPFDYRILENAIRKAVPKLVGAGHPELMAGRASRALPQEIDLQLHPELDPVARQLPGTERAISFRQALISVLIDPDPRGHRELIEELQRSGLPMQTLAIQLFAPVAAYLGNLWCTDETDFMQVAVASTRIGMIINHLSQSRSAALSARETERRVLLARTRGAMHTIGVSIVASCFRDMGWAVEGGGELELDDHVYMRLSNGPYDLLGISVGRVDEAPECAQAIRRIHSNRYAGSMKIAVGGPAVKKDPQAFNRIGADIVARSALEVMQLAD